MMAYIASVKNKIIKKKKIPLAHIYFTLSHVVISTLSHVSVIKWNICVQKGIFFFGGNFVLNAPMCGLMSWENTSIVTPLWSYCQGTFCFATVEMAFLWPVRISWQSWIKMFLPVLNLGNCIYFSLINSIVSIRKELFLPAQNTVSVQKDGFEMLSR